MGVCADSKVGLFDVTLRCGATGHSVLVALHHTFDLLLVRVEREHYKVATSSTDYSRSLISEYSKAHNFRVNDNWVAKGTDSNPP